jgi:murein L,D-transpeptidase YcbB/YkuD
MHETTVIENCGTQKPDTGKNLSNETFHRKSFRYILAALPLALILLISTSYQRNTGEIILPEAVSKAVYFSPEIRNALRMHISGAALEKTDSNVLVRNLVSDLYTLNGFKPVWMDNGINANGKALVYLIQHAREMGLEPTNYYYNDISSKIDELIKRPGSRQNEEVDVELEALMSDAAFRLMINLHDGYRPLDSTLGSQPWVSELPQILFKSVYTSDVQKGILSVEPKFVEYSRLRKASTLYVRSHELNDVNADIIYPQKDTVELMAEIRDALVSLGYIQHRSDDITTTAALKKFQELHGLTADGRAGLNTIEALGKTTLYRYKVLALNLDRLRKNQYPDSDMLYVNIPAYHLKIYDGRKMTGTFRVIVGNPSTPTPLISGNLQKIIANPVWFVPRKIAVNEILPKLKNDSAYLSRNGFKILDKNNKLVDANTVDLNNISEADFDYTFRQNRGSDNSLGQVKFLFDNPYSVYLHDTPSKSLFQKDLRAFSHGCIRIEHPEKLATLILNKINSDTTDFSQAMKTGQQHEYPVNISLPVRITYITCEADESGRVFFYKDIYGIDSKELTAIDQFSGI